MLFACSEQFATLFQAIECLQNLLEYDGLLDAHLNFQNGGNISQ